MKDGTLSKFSRGGTRCVLKSLLLMIIGLMVGNSIKAESAWQTLIEAETMDIAAPAHVRSVVGARDDLCVMISDADAKEYDQLGLRRKGELSLSPTIPHQGVYHLWVRLQWHCTCNRHMTVQTTGRHVSSEDDHRASPNTPVTSFRHPGIWHWINIGSYEFDAGAQYVRFIQGGHRTLIDSIAISDDKEFRPPGYIGEIDRETFYQVEPKVFGPSTSYLSHKLGERNWDDFRLNMVVSMLGHKEEYADGYLGVRFNLRPNDEGYLLSVQRKQNDALTWRLGRTGSSSGNALVEQQESITAGVGHSVMIQKIGREIDVQVDGVALFSTIDEMSVSGRIEVVANNVGPFSVEEVEIETLHQYEEHFLGGSSQWREFSGSWSTVSPNPIDSVGRAYLVRGKEGGLSVSPWPVGNSFRFETRLKILGPGTAGIAFGILDDNNFQALTLAGGNSEKQDLNISLISVRAGTVEELWSTSIEGTIQQWHHLTLEKYLSRVNVIFDARPMATFYDQIWSDHGAVGLMVLGDTTAMFTSTKANDAILGEQELYLFEPETDSRSLSHWKQKKGKFALLRHPALLSMQPEQGQTTAALEFRRTISKNAEIELHLSDRKPTRIKPEADPRLPELELPVFPDAPRVGIRATLEGGKETEFTVMTDNATMRELVLARDGQVLVRYTHPGPISNNERILQLRIDHGFLTAGILGGAQTKLPLGPLPEKARFRLTLVGENLRADKAVEISRILVRDLQNSLP